MKLLLLILSVMTWTVESKSLVSGSGEWPFDIEVSYSNTYNKGQVRSGDEAVLNLSNIGILRVEQVEVYVKSNKSSGAGTFTVRVDGQTAATKSGSLADWTGAFDNTNFHAVALLPKAVYAENSLSVSLQGSENSLVIEKYVITYTMNAVRTVTLMNGSSEFDRVTEESCGSGILLPSVSDWEHWQFAGWSEYSFRETQDPPTLIEAGTIYHPASDAVLWAAFRYYEEPVEEYMTDIASDTYLYVNRTAGIAMSGVPEDGRIGYSRLNPSDERQYYEVEFTSPDTAYITHAQTGTPVGTSGVKMAAEATPWLVWHEGDQTLFYIKKNNKTYVLWLNIMDVNLNQYAGLLEANLGTSPMGLMHVPSESGDRPAYTCHPETPLGTEEVTDRRPEEEQVVRIGTCELHIRNGHKYMQTK